MANQIYLQNQTTPFVRSGLPQAILKEDATIVQNGGRTTNLIGGTLMARIASTGKWTPFTSLSATDGSAIPAGIYVGPDILAAAIVAGDVVNCQILVGMAAIDLNQLTIENSLTLASIVPCGAGGSGATYMMTMAVEDWLMLRGIFCIATIDISGFEN